MIDFKKPIKLDKASAWRTYTGGKMIARLHGEDKADDYFPEARTFVNVHSTATSLGVDAALACLFGDKPFEGKSPVKLKRA
jgi:hypothetical protein